MISVLTFLITYFMTTVITEQRWTSTHLIGLSIALVTILIYGKIIQVKTPAANSWKPSTEDGK